MAERQEHSEKRRKASIANDVPPDKDVPPSLWREMSFVSHHRSKKRFENSNLHELPGDRGALIPEQSSRRLSLLGGDSLTTQDMAKIRSQQIRSNFERVQLDDPKPRLKVQCDAEVNAVATREGMLITGDGTGAVTIWSVDPTTASTTRSGVAERVMKCEGDVDGKPPAVKCLAVKGRGNKIRVVTGDTSGAVHLWNPFDGSLIRWQASSGAIFGIDMDRTCQTITTGDAKGEARVWSGETGDPLGGKKVSDKSVRAIDLNDDATLLATGAEDKKAQVWLLSKCSSGEPGLAFGDKPLANFTCGHNVLAIKISPDSRLLATGDAMSKAKVWNIQLGALEQTMDCGGWVHSVNFADNMLLATGDQHKMAKVWEVWDELGEPSGTLMQTFLATEVVKRVDLSADLGLVACGAGNQSLLFDMESGFLVQMKDHGGRVKLAADKSVLVTVDGNGRCHVWRLLDEEVVAFWAAMAKHPAALATAARCVPGFELVLYSPSPSGRTMATHASANGNYSLLSVLGRAELEVPFAVSTVLQRDSTGYHAVDYALRNRNGRLAELLLEMALRGPPESRSELVVAPPDAQCGLVLLAQLFPSAMMRTLCDLGVDPYYHNGRRDTSYKRAPNLCLNCDHNKMAVCGAPAPYRNDAIWHKLTAVVDDTNLAGPRASLWKKFLFVEGGHTWTSTFRRLRRHTSRYFKLPEPEDASDDEPGGAAAGPHQPSRNLSLLAAVATRATQKSMHEVVDEAVVKSQGEARRQPTTDKVQLLSHRLSSVDHDTSDNETQEDNVDVTCGVVGVPYLMMGSGPHANMSAARRLQPRLARSNNGLPDPTAPGCSIQRLLLLLLVR
mmetsp:Transcript_69819/g.209724  ORF Transcript_69819/g.209724 Transcript_69819/m.209724 type:complete len:841 (+) Transcript_69819:62-2584(+)